MKDQTLTLTMKEEQKHKVLMEYLRGNLKVEQAAQLARRDRRTLFRWKKRYEQMGLVSFIHGLKNQPSRKKTSQQTCLEILKLATEQYQNVNDVQMREFLFEDHHIKIGRETLRSLLRAHGLAPKQARRSPKFRTRRERRSQSGMLLQIDASQHDWLEGRGPILSLIGGVDDATGEAFAVFEDVECTFGYFNLMRSVIEKAGVPLGLYSDRHTIFYKLKEPTLQEQLSNSIPLTQFGRAMKELGVSMTKAYSPQAKGRIERLWRTLQDRLVVELRRAGACSKEQANIVLKFYLSCFNKQFAKKPAVDRSCFRKAPSQSVLDQIFCLKESRVVNKDHTVSYNGRILQIPRGKGSKVLHGRRVEVWEYQNGVIKTVYKNNVIASYQPLAQEVLFNLAA